MEADMRMQCSHETHAHTRRKQKFFPKDFVELYFTQLLNNFKNYTL